MILLPRTIVTELAYVLIIGTHLLVGMAGPVFHDLFRQPGVYGEGILAHGFFDSGMIFSSPTPVWMPGRGLFRDSLDCVVEWLVFY
jgi:hypothetical protein